MLKGILHQTKVQSLKFSFYLAPLSLSLFSIFLVYLCQIKYDFLLYILPSLVESNAKVWMASNDKNTKSMVSSCVRVCVLCLPSLSTTVGPLPLFLSLYLPRRFIIDIAYKLLIESSLNILRVSSTSLMYRCSASPHRPPHITTPPQGEAVMVCNGESLSRDM